MSADDGRVVIDCAICGGRRIAEAVGGDFERISIRVEGMAEDCLACVEWFNEANALGVSLGGKVRHA